ncbi:hypothetical protein ACI782_07180 [Geodermatophilus sp. SYSU D00703]
MAVALVAIGLTAVAGLVVGRSGPGPAQEATAAPPSIARLDTEPVARGGLLAGDDDATPSASAPAETEPPAQEVAADADEADPTRPATASTTAVPAEPTSEPSAAGDGKPDRCTEGRGSAKGNEAAGSRRGGGACR